MLYLLYFSHSDSFSEGRCVSDFHKPQNLIWGEASLSYNDFLMRLPIVPIFCSVFSKHIFLLISTLNRFFGQPCSHTGRHFTGQSLICVQEDIFRSSYRKLKLVNSRLLQQNSLSTLDYSYIKAYTAWVSFCCKSPLLVF